MKFVADECCDSDIIELLRKSGHDVMSIAELNPGTEDDYVLNESFKEDRILITEDKDFGELVCRLKKPTRGVILLRIGIKDKHLKWLRLKQLLSDHDDHIYGFFVVIDEKKFRFRQLS